MMIFPHSRLWFGTSRVVVISGPHIQTLDLAGNIFHSTAFWPDEDKCAILSSGPVRCAVIDKSEKYLATAGDDKRLKIWELEELKLLSERELPKKPTAILFTQNGQFILVSDKFGDVFSYTLHPTNTTPSEGKRDALSSHENPSGGQLVLGHASLLTSFLLTPDERYIITADRDEHIRVSWYPQGYNIQMYCLGHQKYVSSIHIPSVSPCTLISGGGDPMLKIWDWMAGTVKHEISVLDAVAPFIKLRAPKRKRSEDDGDGDDVRQGRRGRRKNRKEKGKGKHIGTADEVVQEPAQDQETVSRSGSLHVDANYQGADEPDTSEVVLVLHKIDVSETDAGHRIVFSAVGATALFGCPFPDDNHVTDIQSFDFGKPVLDFVLRGDAHIWVLLDGQWAEKGTEASGASTDETTMIRVVRWTQGRLSEVVDKNSNPLLLSLNSRCLLPAMPMDLKTLDLYAHLSSMPKNTEAEHNAMDSDFPLETAEPGSNDPSGSGGARTPQGKGKHTSKKVLGRLKNKKLLDAHAHVAEKTADGDVVEKEEPEIKKARSETGHGTGGDVDMAE